MSVSQITIDHRGGGDSDKSDKSSESKGLICKDEVLIVSKLTSSNCLLSSGPWVRIPPGTPSRLQEVKSHGTVRSTETNLSYFGKFENNL